VKLNKVLYFSFQLNYNKYIITWSHYYGIIWKHTIHP
jgi:hypothetical protein